MLRGLRRGGQLRSAWSNQPHERIAKHWNRFTGGARQDRLDQEDFVGSPNPANSSAAEGVDLRLSLAFLFLPIFVWRRVRFFQVWRVFDAMAGGF